VTSAVAAMLIAALGVACSTATPYGAEDDQFTPAKGARPKGDVLETPTTPTTNSAALPQDGSVQLTQIQPPSLLVGNAAATLTITGTGFDANAKVLAGGVVLPTTAVSTTQLTTTLPAEKLAAAGTMTLTVIGSHARSNDMQITIVAGAAIASLAPTSASARASNAGSVTLTVNGSGFDSAAVVVFNGSDLRTQALSPTQLTATVPASLLTAAGQFGVAVRSNGGLSAGIPFTVTAAPPAARPPSRVCNGGATCADYGLGMFQCFDDGFEVVQCEDDGCVYQGCL
jgi:hypothetical protein